VSSGEDLYNTVRRHSTIGYLSPVEFERKVGLAYCLSTKPAAGQFAIASGRAEFGLPISIESTFRFSGAQMMTLVAQKGSAVSTAPPPVSAQSLF
jgi:hypothetical protein